MTCHGVEGSAGKLPPGRPWVSRVDARVYQPIERHGQAPCPDHRNRDPEEVRRARDTVDRQEGADVRKRKREDRVLELDK